jgi:hypothetical protein
VDRATAPAERAAQSGSAAIREGAKSIADKAANAIGPEAAAPAVAGATAPTGPDAALPPAASAPPPAKAASWWDKAGAWVAGKADAAGSNARNIELKIDAVSADANAVRTDLENQLAAINRTHDTFMAGVNAVRAIDSGETGKALRQGGRFLSGTGYEDLGAGLNTMADKREQARELSKAAREGDIAAGLQAAGELAGLQDVAATGRKIDQARRVVSAAQSGDMAATMHLAGKFSESREVEDIGMRMMDLDAAKRAMERGDQSAALTNLGRATGSQQQATGRPA